MTNRVARAAIAAVLALTILGLAAGTSLADQPEKVTICHAAALADEPTNFVTLTLPWVAVYGQAGHFNENGTPQAGHEEDYLGECQGDATPTPEPTPAPICLEDGGDQACGPLVPCEYYGTVWVKVDGMPVQVTLDAIYRAEECASPTPVPTPVPSTSQAPAPTAAPAADAVPDTALPEPGSDRSFVLVLGLFMIALGGMQLVDRLRRR